MKLVRALCLFMLVLLLQVNIVTAQDNSTLKSEIQGINDRMVEAVINQNMSAVMDFYTDDAISLPSYKPMLQGKEAIREQNEKDMKEGSKLTDMKLNTEKVFGRGDMVYEIGTYDVTFTSPESSSSEPMNDKGKYLTVWQKVNGQWKVKAEIWNTNHTPSEMMQAMDKNKTMDNDEMTGEETE